MRLENKVVFITGAASGIGRALCHSLGAEGARLGLLDRNETGLETLEKDLKEAGIRSEWATADVRCRKEVGRAIDSLADRLGPADVLVASAGVSNISPLVDDLMIEQLEETVQVNLLGVVYAIEAVLPDMLMRKSGHIVGISSLAASRGLPFHGAYSASKAALATYLESLRPALRRRGVAVTTVFPGFVRTPMLELLLAASGTRQPIGTLEPQAAARKITKAILRRRRVSYFPWSTSLLVYGARWLPASIYDWIMTRIAIRFPLPY